MVHKLLQQLPNLEINIKIVINLNLKVIIKLIETQSDYQHEFGTSFNEKIIKYSNSQTAVSNMDFRSNDNVRFPRKTKDLKLKYTLIKPFRDNLQKKRVRTMLKQLLCKILANHFTHLL